MFCLHSPLLNSRAAWNSHSSLIDASPQSLAESSSAMNGLHGKQEEKIISFQFPLRGDGENVDSRILVIVPDDIRDPFLVDLLRWETRTSS